MYDVNLLRCEMELRENNLPYITISQMIETIEDGSFQDTIEKYFNDMLKKSVFAELKSISCKSLKEISINLMRHSNRNYKLLFKNADMSREYNYYKRAKEVVTREDDLNFEELKTKLVNYSS